MVAGNTVTVMADLQKQRRVEAKRRGPRFYANLKQRDCLLTAPALYLG